MSNTLCMKVDDQLATPIGEETLDESIPQADDPEPLAAAEPARAVTGEVATPEPEGSIVLHESLLREPTVDEPDPEIAAAIAAIQSAPVATALAVATAVETPEEPVPEGNPRGGTSEVRQFIAMLRSERKARVRTRRLKRLGWVVAAAGAAGWLAARSSDPSEGGVAAGPPAALATVTESLPPVAFEVDPAGALLAPASAEPLGEPAQCQAHFAQQRWRSAVESCTRVFEQAPAAALALRIAHAHYSRGQATPAGFWARTALGLGTKDADAFVLIGHSEREAGHTQNAVDAYQKYLQASPRGWHAKRLRAALRELKPRPAYRQPSARRDTRPPA